MGDEIWKHHVDQLLASNEHVVEPGDDAFDMLPTSGVTGPSDSFSMSDPSPVTSP